MQLEVQPRICYRVLDEQISFRELKEHTLLQFLIALPLQSQIDSNISFNVLKSHNYDSFASFMTKVENQGLIKNQDEDDDIVIEGDIKYLGFVINRRANFVQMILCSKNKNS